MKSVEEKVEDWAKSDMDKRRIRHFAKNESINPEIDKALKDAASKGGGKGGNFPDIQILLDNGKGRRIPVFVEVKGRPGDFGKADGEGGFLVSNQTDKGLPDYAAIRKYAVNGAVHYASAVAASATSFPETLAVGVNGFTDDSGALRTEMAVYYVSKDNLLVPKRLPGAFTDFSFLSSKHLAGLIADLDALDLTQEEKEAKARDIENAIETSLQRLNQSMRDEFKIPEAQRVPLVCAMIMAGLGVEKQVSPLAVSDFKGDLGAGSHDGQIVRQKVAAFLDVPSRNIPREKRDLILSELDKPLLHGALHIPKNGESPLKTIYARFSSDILPFFASRHHLDFTGRLFNVLNSWSHPVTDPQNDVVLTPRYVTDFMARLCRVDRNSYVWDYALGSGGFLVSALNLMVKDATDAIASPDEREAKILRIKLEQLLGIEKLPDVYLLAVLNMILVGDGSANILQADSLTQFSGNYEQGSRKGEPFPANVFLLNPPYSAPGKGLVFVEKALSRMKSGRAAVLIQENAGSDGGLPYAANLLKANTLLASIHMPAKLFIGKASVQTAVYVFEVGRPHDPKQPVRFLDFSEDGYARQNRKKSSLSVNLKDADHARERYDEAVDIVLFGLSKRHYFTEQTAFEDTVTLSGADWTLSQHRRVDSAATPDDFRRVVRDYLAWKVGEILKSEDSLGKPQARG